jgi:enolase-phosphatase E1
VSLLSDEWEPRVVLLDIEGTTTPAVFVYETLFPYARNHLREFLERHQRDAEVMNDLKQLEAERNADAVRGLHPPEWRSGSSESRLSSAAFYAQWLMDRDRKSTGLKSLQGKIWRAGYESGELKGEVYPDVPPALARWQALNRRVCIFSSGSILAQKLLFAHTTAGDLTPLISTYFDTTTGPKTEADSYRKIAVVLALAPQEIMFLSDVQAELDAAQTAGLQPVLCVRDALRPLTHGDRAIHTFDEL